MGLFCRGLHCAGCGKGIPLALVLFLVGLFVTANGRVFQTLEDAAITLGILAAVAWAFGIIVLSLVFGRRGRGPKVVCVRIVQPLYSEAKYVETGDPEWLALGGKTPAEIEARYAPPTISGTVVHVVRDRDSY